jgi:hypothetical protein
VRPRPPAQAKPDPRQMTPDLGRRTADLPFAGHRTRRRPSMSLGDRGSAKEKEGGEREAAAMVWPCWAPQLAATTTSQRAAAVARGCAVGGSFGEGWCRPPELPYRRCGEADAPGLVTYFLVVALNLFWHQQSWTRTLLHNEALVPVQKDL